MDARPGRVRTRRAAGETVTAATFDRERAARYASVRSASVKDVFDGFPGRRASRVFLSTGRRGAPATCGDVTATSYACGWRTRVSKGGGVRGLGRGATRRARFFMRSYDGRWSADAR